MKRNGLLWLIKTMVLTFYVIAMGVMSYAHASTVHFTQYTSLSKAEKAAFVLPDGSLPIFCEQDFPIEGGATSIHCDGCLIEKVKVAIINVDSRLINFKSQSNVKPHVRQIIQRADAATIIKARAPPIS